MAFTVAERQSVTGLSFLDQNDHQTSTPSFDKQVKRINELLMHIQAEAFNYNGHHYRIQKDRRFISTERCLLFLEGQDALYKITDSVKIMLCLDGEPDKFFYQHTFSRQTYDGRQVMLEDPIVSNEQTFVEQKLDDILGETEAAASALGLIQSLSN